ncbi:unnamed protein product [Arabidopsis arenosa]|uniref:Thioredoxin domain-containing protein n=1 Tax=Arabidopsis arenosa TaxID=38785 RepID=A0A8S1ZZW3_ARAAE|nr:unnamed protein product [Arabidopsis arenosa]
MENRSLSVKLKTRASDHQPSQISELWLDEKILTTPRIGTAQKWWEKGLKENMREISSAQELVDSLTNAGDKLVVDDFFSPGCGGCKALHPKICQLAKMNHGVQFRQVNYEEHKSMCYSLVFMFSRFPNSTEALWVVIAALAIPMPRSRNSEMHWQSR